MSLVILACYGFVNGFATSRMLRLFKAGDWKVAATLSSIIFSSFVILLYAVSDIIELKLHTHKAFSIWDAMKYTLLWLLINVPLNALGAKRGYEKELAVEPVVSESGTPVPAQPIYMRWFVTIPVLGSIPFLSILALLK